MCRVCLWITPRGQALASRCVASGSPAPVKSCPRTHTARVGGASLTARDPRWAFRAQRGAGDRTPSD